MSLNKIPNTVNYVLSYKKKVHTEMCMTVLLKYAIYLVFLFLMSQTENALQFVTLTIGWVMGIWVFAHIAELQTELYDELDALLDECDELTD